jgi:hypothetical protein
LLFSCAGRRLRDRASVGGITRLWLDTRGIDALRTLQVKYIIGYSPTGIRSLLGSFGGGTSLLGSN